MSGMHQYAIIPAAGRSRRMGRDKLLMDCDGQPLIDRVLSAWQASVVDELIIVVRHDNEPLLDHLANRPVHLVTPNPAPPEMKDALVAGVRWITTHLDPSEDDGICIAPSDMPDLNGSTIDRVVATGSRQGVATIPTFQGRRGHPIWLPWKLHREILRLGPEQSLRDVIAANSVHEIPVEDAGIHVDLDTSEQLQRWRSRADGNCG